MVSCFPVIKYVEAYLQYQEQPLALPISNLNR